MPVGQHRGRRPLFLDAEDAYPSLLRLLEGIDKPSMGLSMPGSLLPLVRAPTAPVGSRRLGDRRSEGLGGGGRSGRRGTRTKPVTEASRDATKLPTVAANDNQTHAHRRVLAPQARAFALRYPPTLVGNSPVRHLHRGPRAIPTKVALLSCSGRAAKPASLSPGHRR